MLGTFCLVMFCYSCMGTFCEETFCKVTFHKGTLHKGTFLKRTFWNKFPNTTYHNIMKVIIKNVLSNGNMLTQGE